MTFEEAIAAQAALSKEPAVVLGGTTPRSVGRPAPMPQRVGWGGRMDCINPDAGYTGVYTVQRLLEEFKMRMYRLYRGRAQYH